MTLATGTVGILLTSLMNILCLTVLAEATPLGAESPQDIHTTALEFTGCGYNAGHTNCEVEVEELPLVNLLKTGLDEGSLTAESGQLHLICENIFGFIDIDCKFTTIGLLLQAGSQHLTANKTPLNVIGEEFLCPGESQLDGLLETLANAYISGQSKPEPKTALCKTHSSACAEKDQVKSLHMVTTKPPVFYNTVANIECESSLGTATVLGLAEQQKLDVTELTWKGCHTQGPADNCTVTSKSLPTLDLKKTALNLGTVTTLGLKVGIDCTVLGLIELDCVYGSDVTLPAEGALHKEGTGHGMFTASKVVLDKLEGEGHCPESVKWDALYEPVEHVYIVGSPASLSGPAYILG